MKQTYYLTTAIPYANADPHIGFALEILYTDVMARYQRLLGKDVYFLTGTDEHGQKMLKTAKEVGKSVEEYAAEKSAQFLRLADEWNISNNDFIRTTEDRHMKSAQEFWKKSLAVGDIYKKSYTGLYCVGCESFKLETDLVDGKCPDHNKVPETLSEENYFFKLSKYQKPIELLFEQNPNFVYPEHRFKEMKNILKNGLEDVSISRVKEKLPWGVPVPDDGAQVMYVWFDALTNYITALGWGASNETLFDTFWPADAHVIGKEINRFHSLLWPAMLMSAGVALPKQIAVHGWITVDGQKMSKSVGNVIDPLELVKKYPLEAVRYFLMREIQFDNDGDFSYVKFNERYQADLANGLGNLTNRITVMIEKYCDSVIPETTEINNEIVAFAKNIYGDYASAMEAWRFDRALENIWKFISYCDQMISDKQPWAMMKNGKETEVKNMLHHLAESLRHIAIMIWPIMPETSEKLLVQLGLTVSTELAKPLSELQNWVQLTVGNKIAKPEQLFPRLQ
ncbi:MAG: methionine--tRNA ligase [Candidatus Magasanikbacteria bacterium]|nr:methionine--tRNA ligase [Candidatus Magasanikbacteria bacterium]